MEHLPINVLQNNIFYKIEVPAAHQDVQLEHIDIRDSPFRLHTAAGEQLLFSIILFVYLSGVDGLFKSTPFGIVEVFGYFMIAFQIG